MKDLIHYNGYYGSVHFNAQDLFFYGKIEFIRALVSYEATDAKGIKKEFERAVDDYLDLCAEQQIEPETPFKGSLNVRLGPELHKRIAIAAIQNHYSSINNFIKENLDQVLNKKYG